jgi:hypothetical protein
MPVNIHGEDYATVKERLDAAHGGATGRPKDIRSITTEFFPIGTAILCRATVTFEDGRAFMGTSEVPIDSKQAAERDAPFECGETSAVGRALANAGYPGSDKGLAGAEELLQPPRRHQAPAAAAAAAPQNGNGNGHAAPPSGSPASLATTGQVRLLKPLLDFLGIEEHTVITPNLTMGKAADLITHYQQQKDEKLARRAPARTQS